MSPLFIVGILITISSTCADVKNVLEDTAHSSDPNTISPQAVNYLASNPSQNSYWWMNSNSPLKAAYDYYKKCNIKGNCLTSATPQGPAPQPFYSQDIRLDVNKNPFLNGNFKSDGGNAKYNDDAPNININKNPFFKSEVVTTGNGIPVMKDQEGFLGVQPAQPFGKKPGFMTTHPLEQKKKPGFNTKHPLEQEKLLSPNKNLINVTVECRGAGFSCVQKNLCLNGVVNKNGEGLLQVRSDVHYCREDTEVCCQLSKINEITVGKSSIPGSTIKLDGGVGFSPGLIHIQPLNVKPEILFAGEHGHHSSSTSKSIRDTSLNPNSVFSSTVDYSDTKIDNDIRFASSFQGPAYLPPVGPSTPISPKPFETKQSAINQQFVYTKPTTPRNVPSISTTKQPIPIINSLSSTTYRPVSSPTRPAPISFTPTSPPTFKPNPIVTFKPAPSSSREYLPPRQSTLQPSSIQTQYVSPQQPHSPSVSSPNEPGVTQKPYQPTFSTQRPYQSTVPRYQTPKADIIPQKPYQPSITPQQPKFTDTTPQQPYQPKPTTKPYSFSTTQSSTNRGYLPPKTSSSLIPLPSNPFITQQPIPSQTYQSYSKPSFIPPKSSVTEFISTTRNPSSTNYRPTSVSQYSKPPSPTGGYSYPAPETKYLGTKPTSFPFRPTPSILQFSTSLQPRPSPTTGYQYTTPPAQNPFIPQQFTPSRARPSDITPSNVFSTSSNTPSKPIIQPYHSTTHQPYVTQPTSSNPVGGYDYPKPTPSFGYPSTSRPVFGNSNINNQYIPPPKKPGDNPDQSVEAANVDGAFVRPTTPTSQFQGPLNTAPPPGCAAALKCVQEIYCTAEGVISPVPVVLTKEQELSKVPTTVCQDTESGIIGKCCRDPNYKDPWPSANLVNGVDDGQYKEDGNLGQYQPDLQRNIRSDKIKPEKESPRNLNIPTPPSPTCGKRNVNTNPRGIGPLDVNFAEIPWQAMILRDSNRSLLCGGVIIRRDVVLTAAHCVEGLETSDILIKGGEWKLGIDEEPLPFQIVKVAAVVQHPQYQKGSLINDLALLILEEKLRPSKNIATLCLPQANQIYTQNCIATGWGKRILQLHAKGAIMHSIDVKIMDNQQCQETLSTTFQHASTNYSPNTLCGYSNVDQCKVDYGSALACFDGNQYTLSGIYAWDTGCKQQGQIGGYIAPDVEWIESNFAKPISQHRKNNYSK